MIDFKQKIAEQISKTTNIPQEQIIEYIEIPADEKMGDFSFPCFKLAKELKKAPQMIAQEIKDNIEFKDGFMQSIEVVNGYLNFYIMPQEYISNVLTEIANKKENYGESTVGKGKNIVIDYSAPNIAKPFHIGHLRSTVIGNAIYKTYKHLGYNCTGVNHLGDYGTQFGKLIEGYKRWGNEYNVEENPIDELTKIYVRINNLCKEDEAVLEECRNNFKKLEDGDETCIELWNRFKNLSIKEFQKVYNLLNVKFDSWNGEAFYSDKMQEVVDILNKKQLLQQSEGALVVNLDKYDMPPCIIEKTNGSTTYATRDLAAILYRARTYDFDKCLYVVAYEQNLHFKQIFEVAKYLVDEKYAKGLKHISYGMVQLPTGKMSTRLGNVVKIEDLINETIEKAKEIITAKNPDLENKDEVAKKVGIAAIIFNTLSTTNTKDQIFDWNTALNFQGETGPYIQYTYVRTKSVLEKVGRVPELSEVDFSQLTDESSIKVLKSLYAFQETLEMAAEKNEPAILARYLIEVSQNYSNFYNDNKVLVDDEKVKNARTYLTYAVGVVLKTGASLLGIKMPDKM